MRVSEDYWDELGHPNVKLIPVEFTIRKHVRRRPHVAYFPFVRKRSLPVLTVDATRSNQAFSHDKCNIFPGLSYKERVRKNDVGHGAQVEFALKFTKWAKVTCY